MEEIRLNIDNREVTGHKGQTILEIARENNIYIPSLCYNPKITTTGACRMCIVRINDTMIKTSCTEPAANGMKIETEDEEIISLRKEILNMLLAEGDHNCLYCESNGDCELQDLIIRYDIDPPLNTFPKNTREIDTVSNEGLRRNENRCILCGRCVKACAEIQVKNVWDFAGRGSGTHLTADLFDTIGDSSCVKCGTCVQLCPTGALSFQKVLGSGPSWELEKESSICIYCGVGCKIDFYKNKEGQLVKALGNDQGPNNGHLCVKGRFGFDFVQGDKRIKTPLIKKNGKFEEAGWDEALDLVASKISEAKEKSGPDSIMAFSSAKCTNEENYLMQKFMRAVVGTNNVDHCARL